MIHQKLELKFQQLFVLLMNKELLKSMNLLEEIVQADKNSENKNELMQQKETYKYMLKYYAQGISDPQREDIYDKIFRSLLDLMDKVRESIYSQNLTLKIYAWKRRMEKYSHTIIKEINKFDKNSKNENYPEEQIIKDLKNIFTTLWFTDKYTDEQVKTVKSFFKNEEYFWYEKSLIINGITLSLFRCFDAAKINLLFDIFAIQENQIWQRALVGLLIGLYLYEKRLQFYPELKTRLKVFDQIPDSESKIESVLLQLIKSKETEDIVKKFHKEILPEVIKLQPKINEKLDLDEIFGDNLIDDENPEWEKIFGETPDGFIDKMQEFSMMQIEGSDVLMSAFSKLKDFDFFNDIGNWFIPFYKENPTIINIFKNSVENDIKEFNTEVFIERLEKSLYMCNSDKFSFCLNLERMQTEQKNMILNLFNMELDGINEIKEDEKLTNPASESEQIITQYIQDIYRFFKLNPNKKEFQDIFSLPLDIYNKSFFNDIVTEIETIRNLAELYFSKSFYDEAIGTYELLISKGESDSELYEKTAYSYQLKLDYKKALSYYHKAEFFDVNTKWINKKIAFCHLKLTEYEKALEYYKKAEKVDEEDLHTQTNIGHCYLHLEKYEEALKHYFKVEFYAPSNIKIMRPIAWCSFIVGKFKQSIKYYKKLFEKEASKYDFMNIGHVYWCENNKEMAIKYYEKSIIKFKEFKNFRKDFYEDAQYLYKQNISKFDIKLLLDYLNMTYKNI